MRTLAISNYSTDSVATPFLEFVHWGHCVRRALTLGLIATAKGTTRSDARERDAHIRGMDALLRSPRPIVDTTSETSRG